LAGPFRQHFQNTREAALQAFPGAGGGGGSKKKRWGE